MNYADNKLTRIGVFYDGNFFSHVSNYYLYHHQRRARINITGLHDFIRKQVAAFEGIDERYCQIVDAHYFRGRFSAREAQSRNQLYGERLFDDVLVREGDVVDYAGIRLEVFDVPGHSPGHVIYLFRGTPHLVFGGDVLFRDGIGRYDFPGSDGSLLFRGIREKLFTLPADTVVYPGHGPATTIGHEKRSNPFVGEG